MTLLLGAGALTFFVLLSVLVKQVPQVVLYAFTLLAVSAWDWPTLPALAGIGGASIYAEDAVAAAALLSILLHPQRFWSTVRPYIGIVLVTAIALAGSVAFGIAHFGNAAINEFRTFLYPLVAVAWALNQEWAGEAWKGVMRRWATVTGALVSLTAVTHIALYGLGNVNSFVTSKFSGVMQTGRPLTAGQAVLLALCAVYLLQGLSSRKRLNLGWAALFIVITLVAQHRSVWIAMGAGLVVMFFKVHGVARTRIVVGAVVGAWAIAVLALSGIFNPFSDKFTDAVENLGTYGAREDSWTTLIGQTLNGGPGPVVFGSPFGSGFRRIENGVYVDWAPHNWYVTVYLRLGLFALVAFAILLLMVLARLLKARGAGSSAAAFALILTYCWAYSLTWYVAPFFAWAMWSARQALGQVESESPLPPADERPKSFSKVRGQMPAARVPSQQDTAATVRSYTALL